MSSIGHEQMVRLGGMASLATRKNPQFRGSWIAAVLVGVRLVLDDSDAAKDMLIGFGSSPEMTPDMMEYCSQVARYIACGESGDPTLDIAVQYLPVSREDDGSA